MKKRLIPSVLITITAFALSGCSIMTNYIVRNFSKDSVLVSFNKFSTQFHSNNYVPVINSASEIVDLTLDGIKEIDQPIKLITNDSVFTFIIAPQTSVNISVLFDRNNLLPDSVVVKKANLKILQFNSRDDVAKFFKTKQPGLLGSGGWVYYRDIK